MNQESEFTEIAREILGVEYLQAIVDEINSVERAGLHPVLKEVSSALKAFSSENDAEYQLKLNERNQLILTWKVPTNPKMESSFPSTPLT